MIRILTWFLALCPQLLMADAIAVRSGEHAGFTRLVLDFATPSEFDVFEEPDRWSFRFSGRHNDLDISDIFRRIPRSRLTDASVDAEGQLTLDIGCDCRSRVFTLDNGALVIDILDRPDGQFLRPPLPGFPNLANRTSQQTRLAQDPDAVDPWQRHVNRITLLSGPLESPPPLARQPSSTNLFIPELELRAEVRTRFPELNDVFAREIARAAAQGLIAAGAAPSEGRTGNDALQLANTPLNLSIQTAIDRDLESALRGLGSAETQCWPTARTDVANWGGDYELTAGIGELRSQLLGEFDRPNPHVARDLVRHLVYLSFGAEARQVLTTFIPDDTDFDVLWTLSRLVEGDPPGNDQLISQTGCDGAGGLWAAIAAPDLHGVHSPNRSSVILSFGNLPRHLRRHLGPQLAAKFAKSGDDAAAVAIRNATERSGLPLADALTLLDASLAHQQGTEPDHSALTRVALSGSDLSADALILLVEARRHSGEKLPQTIAETAAALQAENFGTPRYADLLEAEIDAWILSGRIAVAIARLEATGQTLGPATFNRLSEAALARLTREAPDHIFVAEMFRPGFEVIISAATSSRFGALLRLNRLGFDERSNLLYGKVGLGDGRRPLAPTFEAYLVSRNEPELLAELGARAQIRGNHLDASDLFRRADDRRAQAIALWRQGALQDLAEDGGEPWQNAVASIATAPPRPIDTRDLGSANRGISDSQTLRDSLTSILQRFPPIERN